MSTSMQAEPTPANLTRHDEPRGAGGAATPALDAPFRPGSAPQPRASGAPDPSGCGDVAPGRRAQGFVHAVAVPDGQGDVDLLHRPAADDAQHPEALEQRPHRPVLAQQGRGELADALLACAVREPPE